jgi:hypothetical protein
MLKRTMARVVLLVFLLALAAGAHAQTGSQLATEPTPSSTASAPAQEAQQQQQTPSATSGQHPMQPGQKSQDKDQKDQKDKDQKNKEGTSNDRLFFAMPNFLTLENSAHVPPLTVGQKFKVAWRSSFDYFQYPWYAALAGISQAQNSEPGYGQGAEGYAKRYGAAFADGTIENFMVNAIVPSVMRTDPRYYQLGKGSFWHRTGYALSRLVITRADSGHNTFNFAEVGGAGMAAAISTYSYHPEADKTFSNTMTVWGTQVSYDALRIVLNEFWPDIRRKFHKDKQPQP